MRRDELDGRTLCVHDHRQLAHAIRLIAHLHRLLVRVHDDELDRHVRREEGVYHTIHKEAPVVDKRQGQECDLKGAHDRGVDQ